MSGFPKWSYALSLVHAVAQSWKTIPYTFHFVFVDKFDTTRGPDPNLYWECAALFMAYISLDSLMHWQKLGRMYQAHHVLTAAATAYNILYGPHALGMCVLSNEVSTIFLSAKALLPKQHPLRPRLYQCFGWSFFVFRIVLNFLLVICSFHVSAGTTVLMSSIWGMNVVWFGKGLGNRLCW